MILCVSCILSYDFGFEELFEKSSKKKKQKNTETNILEKMMEKGFRLIVVLYKDFSFNFYPLRIS